MNSITHDLWLKARNGDREAYDRLFGLHAERALLFIRARLGPRLREKVESVDVLQDAYLAAQKVQRAGVVAVCSRDPKKLAGDWRGLRGNLGPPGEMMDLTALKKFDIVVKNPGPVATPEWGSGASNAAHLLVNFRY